MPFDAAIHKGGILFIHLYEILLMLNLLQKQTEALITAFTSKTGKQEQLPQPAAPFDATVKLQKRQLGAVPKISWSQYSGMKRVHRCS